MFVVRRDILADFVGGVLGLVMDDELPSGRDEGQAGTLDRATEETRGQRVQSARDVEHDLMAGEVDGLGLLSRSIGDGDRRPRLARSSPGPASNGFGIVTPSSGWKRITWNWIFNRWRLAGMVPVTYGITSGGIVTTSVGSLQGPCNSSDFVVSFAVGTNILVLVIGVEHHDPHSVTIRGVGLNREVKGPDHDLFSSDLQKSPTDSAAPPIMPPIPPPAPPGIIPAPSSRRHRPSRQNCRRYHHDPIIPPIFPPPIIPPPAMPPGSSPCLSAAHHPAARHASGRPSPCHFPHPPPTYTSHRRKTLMNLFLFLGNEGPADVDLFPEAGFQEGKESTKTCRQNRRGPLPRSTSWGDCRGPCNFRPT